jgi:hypothetical protein
MNQCCLAFQQFSMSAQAIVLCSVSESVPYAASFSLAMYIRYSLPVHEHVLYAHCVKHLLRPQYAK